MIDPGTGLTVLGGAIGSKELVQKILGPTAEYLGAGLAGWTERAIKNTGRIFESAARKLGDQVDQPGAVPPKVLKGVLETAPFCDDQLGAEYFGGVLASSRSGIARDDRGSSFLSLLARLSTYQIRSHYVFYLAIQNLYAGVNENINVPEGRANLTTFVPMHSYASALKLADGEDLNTILPHVLFGLSREALIGETFRFGATDHVKQAYPDAREAGIIWSPSVLGVELYLWAHGKGNAMANDILVANTVPSLGIAINTTPGICSVQLPDKKIG